MCVALPAIACHPPNALINWVVLYRSNVIRVYYFGYQPRFYPLILLFAGGVIYWHKDSLGAMGEPIIILIGASLIIAAHWVNLRLVRLSEGLLL